MLPKVSVAMATYNGARFLAEQLASLAAQTHLPFELVICDDGSSDETLAILRQFAGNAPFSVVVHRNPERLGYRGNFIRAASLCRGALVSFCDQDDVWDPRKLAIVAAAFDRPSVMLVGHQAMLIDSDGRPMQPFDSAPGGDKPFEHDPWPLIHGFAQTFRSAVLAHKDLWSGSKSHFLADTPVGHDRWALFVAACLGEIRVLPDRLVSYRQHAGNTFGALQPDPAETGRWAARPGDEAAAVALRHAAATSRLRMLEALAARQAPDGGARLGPLLERYRDLQWRLDQRLRILHGPLGSRLAALTRLVVEGAYTGSDAWHLPRRALRRDAWLAVAGPG